MIPPNVNFHVPNPAIRWKEYGLRVPVRPIRLPCHSSSGRSLISLSSSGIGGANGHCVVESPPFRQVVEPFWSVKSFEVPHLFIAGALSPRSTMSLAEGLKHTISHLDPQSISLILGRRSRSMPWRSYSLLTKGNLKKFSEPYLTNGNHDTPLVFVFSGQGPQHLHSKFDILLSIWTGLTIWIIVGRYLFRACSVFRSSILEMDRVYSSVCGESLIEKTGLFDETVKPSEELQEPWPIAITLPALAMFQIALFDVLTALGTKPNVVIGHSAGETAVLYASGAGSKAMAVELAIARGQAMSIIEHESGSMAALSCSPEMAQEFIRESGVDLDIACYNTPNAITLSGPSSSLDKIIAKAEAVGIFARRLRTRIPVHSSMMEACQFEYRKLVEAVFERHPIAIPSIPTYLTGSGKLMKSTFSPDYFWDSARGPVLFTDAIQSILQDYTSASYVEISPHPVLSSYLDFLSSGSAVIVCPLRRSKPGREETEIYHLLDALGKLVAAGHNCIDFNILNGTHGEEADHLLPQYPFVPRKVVLTVQSSAIAKVRQSRNGPFNPHLQINTISHPQLAQHVIKAEPIMPATGFLEMVGAKLNLNEA